MKNLYKRSIFGTLFLVVVIASLLCSYAYAALSLFIIVIAAVEFYRLLEPDRRYLKEKISIILAGAAFFLLSYCHFEFGMDPRFLVCPIIPVTAAYIFMLRDCSSDYAFSGTLFMPLIYIALPIASTLLLSFSGGSFDGMMILGILIMIWCNDVGAYCFGTAFGQKEHSRKLAPKISPKKSWIGVAGGTFCTLAASAVLALTGFGLQIGLVHWLAVGLIVSSVGVCGDLFESLVKRHAGVKDSGNIIPGHGGILDRFDDILLLMPLVAAYLKLFSLI